MHSFTSLQDSSAGAGVVLALGVSFVVAVAVVTPGVFFVVAVVAGVVHVVVAGVVHVVVSGVVHVVVVGVVPELVAVVNRTVDLVAMEDVRLGVLVLASITISEITIKLGK